MTDLLALARARVSTRTHYDGCEADHVECLIHALADEIERLRAWQRTAIDMLTLAYGAACAEHDPECLTCQAHALIDGALL